MRGVLMLRRIDMYQDMSLWRTVHIVATKDTLHDTALRTGRYTFIQLYGCISAYISRNATRSVQIGLYTLTATIGIMLNNTARQLDIRVLHDVASLTAAIYIIHNMGASQDINFRSSGDCKIAVVYACPCLASACTKDITAIVCIIVCRRTYPTSDIDCID